MRKFRKEFGEHCLPLSELYYKMEVKNTFFSHQLVSHIAHHGFFHTSPNRSWSKHFDIAGKLSKTIFCFPDSHPTDLDLQCLCYPNKREERFSS
jgi:hypothetical protein